MENTEKKSVELEVKEGDITAVKDGVLYILDPEIEKKFNKELKLVKEYCFRKAQLLETILNKTVRVDINLTISKN